MMLNHTGPAALTTPPFSLVPHSLDGAGSATSNLTKVFPSEARCLAVPFEPEVRGMVVSGAGSNEAYFASKVDLLTATHEGEQMERREQTLNKVIGVTIVLNAVVMGLELDYGPTSLDVSPSEVWGWLIVESVFVVIFIVEWVLRLAWEGRQWRKSPWNILDCVVLFIAMCDIWVLPFVVRVGSGGLQVVTLIKFARLVRLLRVLRLVRMFRALHVTIMAFKSAMTGLVYIGSITVLGLFMCAIFTTAAIGKNEDLKTIELGLATAEERFGTIPHSMYSLFEIMTLEGWTEVARPLVMAKPGLGIFMCGFIMVFTFGLMNMIVANVVDRTIAESKKLDELTDKQIARKVVEELTHLKIAFQQIDADQSGTINRTEFLDLVQQPQSEARVILEALNVPCSDATALFNILDADNDNCVTLEELIQGVARLKGANNPEWDMLSLHSQVRVVARDVQEMRTEMAALVECLDGLQKCLHQQDTPKSQKSMAQIVESVRQREELRHWTGEERDSSLEDSGVRVADGGDVRSSFARDFSEHTSVDSSIAIAPFGPGEE